MVEPKIWEVSGKPCEDGVFMDAGLDWTSLGVSPLTTWQGVVASARAPAISFKETERCA
jgi:hypothetical protein